MIYLQNKDEKQAVLMPRMVRVYRRAGWQLELCSKANNATFHFDELEDSGDFYTYVHIKLNIMEPRGRKKIQEGEYVYTLRNGSAVVSEGLIYVGEYAGAPEQLETERTIIQYNG